MRQSRRIVRRAFTLVELIAVIVVLGVLATVAVPKYFDYADRAKSAALEGSLGGVRSAVASFYANTTFEGAAAYPTFAELGQGGEVLEQTVPKNPYNGLSTVKSVTSSTDADNRVTDGTTGWCYFVDNTATPPRATFWANCDNDTTVVDGNGDEIAANDL